MSGSEVVNVITYAGLAVSVVMIISVLRLHGHAWEQAGRRKWLWALLPVVTYFILLSIPVALWYYVAIRPSVARADAECIAARRSRRTGRLQASAALPASSDSDGAFKMPDKVQCTSCQSGQQQCWSCSGRGVQQMDNQGNTAPCFSCSGSGSVKCTSCGGTGYRNWWAQ